MREAIAGYPGGRGHNRGRGWYSGSEPGYAPVSERHPMTWREVDAAEWATVVMGRQDDGPTTRLMKERTKDAAEVQRLQAADHRRLYVAPAEGPPKLAFAVSPANGAGMFHSAAVRAIGDYAYLPDLSHLLGEAEMFRILTCSDSLPTMHHLNPERLTTQYTRALSADTVPEYPSRVENLGTTVSPLIRDLWGQFWYNHEHRRAALGLRQAPAERDEDLEQWIAQDLADEARYFTTGETGRRLGIARCRRHPYMEGILSVEGNYVDPDYRGQGIGRDQLLARLHFGFHTLGCVRAISSVAPGNEESEQNLIGRGFAEESSVYLIRRR